MAFYDAISCTRRRPALARRRATRTTPRNITVPAITREEGSGTVWNPTRPGVTVNRPAAAKESMAVLPTTPPTSVESTPTVPPARVANDVSGGSPARSTLSVPKRSPPVGPMNGPFTGSLGAFRSKPVVGLIGASSLHPGTATVLSWKLKRL